MVQLECNRTSIRLKCSGSLELQTREILTGLHAWTCNVAEVMGLPLAKEALRIVLAEALEDKEKWSMTPEAIVHIVEVDDPRELFEEGEP